MLYQIWVEVFSGCFRWLGGFSRWDGLTPPPLLVLYVRGGVPLGVLPRRRWLEIGVPLEFFRVRCGGVEGGVFTVPLMGVVRVFCMNGCSFWLEPGRVWDFPGFLSPGEAFFIGGRMLSLMVFFLYSSTLETTSNGLNVIFLAT